MLNIKKLIFIYLTSFFIGSSILCSNISATNMNPHRKTAFNFVVMGDNRPQGKKGKHVQPEVFYKIIDEVNLLDPEFAIILGDLIFGYSKSPNTLKKMWDEFDKAVNKFTVPYYLVIGNHDVSNQAMEDYYLGRYGNRFPAYYSFNHKKSHFIILDSEIPGAEAQISGKQLEWLKKDLKNNKNTKHIFVFLHRPLQEEKKPTNWMTEIHPLMVKHNVNTVFAGHWHVYQKSSTRDGVRYIITGGAGAPVGKSTVNGSFFHYLLVTVRDNNTSIALIRPNSITNEEIVNQTTVNNTDEMIVELSTIYLPKDIIELPSTLNLVVKNRFNVPVTGKFHFTKNKKTPWNLPTNNIISLSPGETQKIALEITKSITTKNLKNLKPVPRIFWELNIGELNFNIASNRRIKLIVDDWPYSKDVDLLASESVTVTPITAENKMSENIIVTYKNPIKHQPIIIKTKWILPPNSNWKLQEQLNYTADLKSGEEIINKTPFSFTGNHSHLFPLPYLEINAYMQGVLIWQESSKLPLLAKTMFQNKTVTSSAIEISSLPKIDGVLNDPEWKKCKVITGFLLEHANDLPFFATEARLAYDNKNLYIAIHCHDDNIKKLRMKSRKHDGGVYNDDSIELFIDANLDKTTYFQYAINAAGLIYDSRNKDKSWSGPMTSKIGREENAWTLELSIPWETLKILSPVKGSKIGLNIIRNKMHKPIEHSQWVPTFGKKHTPSLFGVIEFK